MLRPPLADRPSHRPSKVSTVAMAANQSTLDSANQLSTLAAQLQQIRIENQAQAGANAELTTQVSAIQTSWKALLHRCSQAHCSLRLHRLVHLRLGKAAVRWDLIQQRIRAREEGDKPKQQDFHKQVRSQARHDETQWLRDMAESEETVDARMKWKWIRHIRSEYKQRRVSFKNFQGKPTNCSAQAQTSIMGPNTNTQAATPPSSPQRRRGPITHHRLGTGLEDRGHEVQRCFF